ncbi:DUF2934 domain-containing protein [Sphingomonas sp. H39-1-10]|uniref:DUF2934 domain-containing protein n=1 Tax=Sphingomonas pollutisoli TaxID=3030829 RepID=UPI0023B9A789|nr:DUF2934 domain-containing protein [Sphingomonas pollutisoli]MDF0488748.1 DUF2934 domain-containing protein [Sphingomonas pollutisoli]
MRRRALQLANRYDQQGTFMEQDRISQVRQRAHAIWIEQGQPEGVADQHWAQAEAEFDAAAASESGAAVTEAADAPAVEPEAAVEPTPPAEPESAAAAEPAEAAAPAPAKKPAKRRVKPLTPIR